MTGLVELSSRVSHKKHQRACQVLQNYQIEEWATFTFSSVYQDKVGTMQKQDLSQLDYIREVEPGEEQVQSCIPDCCTSRPGKVP